MALNICRGIIWATLVEKLVSPDYLVSSILVLYADVQFNNWWLLVTLLEEELGSRLTLSSLKGQQSSFISFQRMRRQRDGKRETEMDAYSGGWLLFFLPTADARHSGFNRAHFKTQHSCLLCIWAPIERGGRREERSRREQVKPKKKKRRQGMRMRERAGDGLCREKRREREGRRRRRREEETKADTDNIYQRSTNMGPGLPL